MAAAIRGRLIAPSFVDHVLPRLEEAAPIPQHIRSALERLCQACDERMGPASSVRTIADIAVVPLARLLGFGITRRPDSESRCALEAAAEGTVKVLFIVTPWAESLSHQWRSHVLAAIGNDTRWCFCCNGRSIRLIDARQTWSRGHVEFDLAVLAHDRALQTLFWTIARFDAMATTPAMVEQLAQKSAWYSAEVCTALGGGVLEALRLLFSNAARRQPKESLDACLEHSLTIVYRVLFLLFAEARGLVPIWHDVYRDRYSLGVIVDALLSGRHPRGLWHAVQAISRLAHAGCSAGELKVTAFNGRLFSPLHAATFDRRPVSDAVMERVIDAVSTTTGNGAHRTKIAYADLDVEQLGAVYEQVLEHQPSPCDAQSGLVRTRDLRKSSGTFYTPRSVTSHLVRRTLTPLVRNRMADDILSLRILDPAAGSGAFLVAGCHFLAAAAEDALLREGRWQPDDITPASRAELKRDIAARCLFGVDINPTAIQLARLSLWLATLAADRPLTFLDHHLVSGDSLLGATPADIHRQPSGMRRRAPAPRDLPLFGEREWLPVLEAAVRARAALAAEPDSTAAIVRAKEDALATLHSPHGPLGRWTRVLDLWCAGWFWPDSTPPDRATFLNLVSFILHGHSSLPPRLASELLERAARTSVQRRFLHWPLVFPEIFQEAGDGGRRGFDAVLGNPPWDMIRGDSGEGAGRVGRRLLARQVTSFVRESGTYRFETSAHPNQYQLFVERALQLVRPGGRVGLVLPSGVLSDAGAAPLRRHLFDRAEIDEVTGLDNSNGIFAIHRSMRFTLLTCTPGAPTRSFQCRFGVSRVEDLERPTPDARRVSLSRKLLERLSGPDDLGVPQLAGTRDLRLLERISADHLTLGDATGWNVQFSRELNATDDRALLIARTDDATARPVVEGKHVEPFRVAVERCPLQVDPAAEGRVRVPRAVRLAYRDVASATNRLTLIAAVIPANAVTTHTLFCLKRPPDDNTQRVLCALMNSFVANYLIRMRVHTHVTASLVRRLPVPLVRPTHHAFDHLAALARALTQGAVPVEEMQEYGALQGLAAFLYGLDAEDFEHVLSTFPLISTQAKSAALDHLNALLRVS